MPTIKGKLFWSYINQPDSKYDLWRVTWVGDAKGSKFLKSLGLKPKMVDEDENPDYVGAGTHFFKFTRYCKRRGKGAGTPNTKPKCAIVVDEDGTKDWFTGIIGNGSEGIIQFGTFPWVYKGKEGTSADLQGVVITKLVEFVPTGGDEEEEEDSLFADMGDAPDKEEDPNDYDPEDNEDDDSSSEEDDY